MCPMDGKCNNQNMIYQAEVTTPTSRETYIGLCDTTFKLRYRNHVCSFKNERYKHATELSKYIWSLKDKSILYNIKWRKVKQARSYSNISKRCNLCLWEKYFIIYKPDMSTLNNTSELISNCRHSKKFLLKNVLAQPITFLHVTPVGIVLYFQILYIIFCIRYFWHCLMIAPQGA